MTHGMIEGIMRHVDSSIVVCYHTHAHVHVLEMSYYCRSVSQLCHHASTNTIERRQDVIEGRQLDGVDTVHLQNSILKKNISKVKLVNTSL